MRHVFVTGLNGLLAKQLVKTSLAAGHRVSGSSRQIQMHEDYGIDHASIVEREVGNITPADLHDIDVLIHASAYTKQTQCNYRKYYASNALHSHALLKAAIKAGVKRFVFISTANTLSLNQASCKTDPIYLLYRKSFYARSKRSAEKMLLVHDKQIELLIVHPTFMLSALDSKQSSNAIFNWVYKKRLIWVPPGGKNFVALADVAEAVVASICKPHTKQHLLVIGQNASYLHFFSLVRQQLIQSSIMLLMPKCFMKMLTLWSVFKSDTSINKTNMQILMYPCYYEAGQANENLSVYVCSKSIEEIISACIANKKRI